MLKIAGFFFPPSYTLNLYFFEHVTIFWKGVLLIIIIIFFFYFIHTPELHS